MGTLSSAQSSNHPCSIRLTEGSVWREGEHTGTPFSVHTWGLAFKTGSSSRTELGFVGVPSWGSDPAGEEAAELQS